MVTLVELRAPSGDVVALGHGSLIGRLWSADLHVNDARISEAHAMISLRGRDVRMLALRGRFHVGGRMLSDVVLTPGMTVSLTRGVDLEVLAVHTPGPVLALEADGVPRQVLTGVTSLFGGPDARVLSGWDAAADDYVWPTGAAWMRGKGTPIPVEPGDTWAVKGVAGEVDGTPFRAIQVLGTGANATVGDLESARPITLTARFDTVHIARPGHAVVVLTGQAARVISELVAAGTALSWEDLARDLWPDADRELRRHRWDMQIWRLRAKLGTHGLRKDLLRADGTGLVELVLAPEDTVVDQT